MAAAAADEKRPLASQSVIKAVQDYITRAISVPGMKAFILDPETMSIVSLVYSQTEIINREVFLTERIDQSAAAAAAAAAAPAGGANAAAAAGAGAGGATKMQHLKAVLFLRPDRANIEHLKAMLAKPKYKEYHIFFTNILPEEYLKQLADADEFELIRQVQEYYADYFAVNPNLWHLNLFDTRSLHEPQNQWSSKQNRAFQRNVTGIVSNLLSLKKRPVIRYSRQSELCHYVATAVNKTIRDENALFHFGGQNTTPLLLVLDRRDDPVTPLLMQWTYQAMVHELLGLQNNRLDMSKVKDIRKELREVVLSCDSDAFFRQSMYLNFGDLGASVKHLVEAYQAKTKSNQKLESIADMQRFVENYPEFKQMSGNVSKHVAIMTELSHQVDARDLMEIATLEQELACQQDHSSALEKVLKVLEEHKTAFEDKLRVAALYALRYESEQSSVNNVKAILRTKAITDENRARAGALDALLAYAGVKSRSGDLFGNKSFFAKASKFFGSGLKGVENVFSQHKPLLAETLDAVVKNQLKPQLFPFVDGKDAGGKFTEVFVYIVGGVTYEEATYVTAFNENKENGGVRVVLGGSCVHNSNTFLDDVLQWADKQDVRIDVASSAGAHGAAGGGGGGRRGGNQKFDL